MRESKLERWFAERILTKGGVCLKWVSPGASGVPDRIVLMPKGRLIFIEFKADVGKLTERQQMWRSVLIGLGFSHMVITSEAAAKSLLRELDS